MDFDGNQPIRVEFWNDAIVFTKQKAHGKTAGKTEFAGWLPKLKKCGQMT